MLNYGIISASSIVERFMAGVAASKDGRVIAIGARDIERARQKGERYGVKYIYGSYDEVYENKEVDVVYIANINHLHFAEAKKALQHGKHVLVEKPFAISSQDADELFTLAEENGLFIMEAQKSVFLPITKKAKEIVFSGELGELNMIEMGSSYTVDKIPWMKEIEYGGGTLFGNSIYTVEYLNFFLETVFEDAAVISTFFDEGAESQSVITFKKDNILALSRISSVMNCVDGVYFYMTKGYVYVKNYWKARSLFVHYNDPKIEDKTIEIPVESEFVYEVDHVNDCIKAAFTQSPIMGKEQTIGAIKLIEKLAKMSRSEYNQY